jgi:N-alpha-acetyl-L-2,4-diaminobutyrate deacetylase
MSADLSPISTSIDFDKDGKQVSFLKVPHSRNDSAWGSVLIPITVIKNGMGRTVLLLAGSHGGEYEGPVALTKLSYALEAQDIQGRVIIIPALNLPAVMAGERLSPIDSKDMNRVFPGKWNGTITEVIAHYIHEVILPLCDAVLDIHSGGYSLNLAPYISMHYLDNQIQTEQTLAALMAFQAPIGIIMREFSGSGLLDYAVEGMGKIFLCAELGGSGRLSGHTLHIAEVGTRNFLKHFDILQGDSMDWCISDNETQLMEVAESANYHIVMGNGVYESLCELGQEVEIGQILGQVHFIEYPSKLPEQVFASRSGTIIGIRGPSQVSIGDCVAVVAQGIKESL